MSDLWKQWERRMRIIRIGHLVIAALWLFIAVAYGIEWWRGVSS